MVEAEVGVIFETLLLVKGVEVAGGIMGDIGGLIAQDFLGKVFEDGGEVVGNRKLLNVATCHNKNGLFSYIAHPAQSRQSPY